MKKIERFQITGMTISGFKCYHNQEGNELKVHGTTSLSHYFRQGKREPSLYQIRHRRTPQPPELPSGISNDCGVFCAERAD